MDNNEFKYEINFDFEDKLFHYVDRETNEKVESFFIELSIELNGNKKYLVCSRIKYNDENGLFERVLNSDDDTVFPSELFIFSVIIEEDSESMSLQPVTDKETSKEILNIFENKIREKVSYFSYKIVNKLLNEFIISEKHKDENDEINKITILDGDGNKVQEVWNVHYIFELENKNIIYLVTSPILNEEFIFKALNKETDKISVVTDENEINKIIDEIDIMMNV